MNTMPECTQCGSSNVYEYAGTYTCPECAHEWSGEMAPSTNEEMTFTVFDVNGVELKDGDTVMVIKDLKVKGAPAPLKAGTKVKNIRLVDSDHNIDCKISGIGAMGLKSEFVKKVIG